MTERIYLNVPYSEKDAAKKKGARWDGENRGWWINSGASNLRDFQTWLPRKFKVVAKPPFLTSEMVPPFVKADSTSFWRSFTGSRQQEERIDFL